MKSLIGALALVLIATSSAWAAPQVTLTWQNNAPFGSQVNVWRSPGACPLQVAVRIDTLSGQPTTYVDTTVVNGNTYCYTIDNAQPPAVSGLAVPVSVTVPFAPLGTPSGLQGAAIP